MFCGNCTERRKYLLSIEALNTSNTQLVGTVTTYD